MAGGLKNYSTGRSIRDDRAITPAIREFQSRLKAPRVRVQAGPRANSAPTPKPSPKPRPLSGPLTDLSKLIPRKKK